MLVTYLGNSADYKVTIKRLKAENKELEDKLFDNKIDLIKSQEKRNYDIEEVTRMRTLMQDMIK